MSYTDRASLLAGSHERQPISRQGNVGPRGMNLYHQQQLQEALYQQQQIEFAQQQTQLEMHFQLEQMRLQNLALQEQIMLGQVQAQQQSQAQAENQLRSTLYASAKPMGSNRLNLTQSQGSVLAERALARRQQAEADALYHHYYPGPEESIGAAEASLADAQLLELQSRHGTPSPPAVVVSKPGASFPVFAPAQTSAVKISPPAPKLTTKSQKQIELEAAGKNLSDNSALPGLHNSANGKDSVSSAAKNAPMVTPGKKFSEVVKSSPVSDASLSGLASAAAKLNPFSSVFVPGSNGGSEQEQAPAVSPEVNELTRKNSDSSSQSECSERNIASITSAAPSNVYRAPKSKTPPSSTKAAASRIVSAPLANMPSQSLSCAMPTRQPRGPAAEAELTNQNFATRIRKRAIGAIKTLGPRQPASPGLLPSNAASYQYYQQQQHLLDALIVQQQQQQVLAAAGFLDTDPGYYSSMVSPGGIAHLMATARAREERFGY
ncbi:hypothetical protein PPACK8108_LOCUS11928 [Phakopsora pachyrhizi]|uniref:Uncharacterized protein n=1 Tax=Phakopsora pachyrhizi TaxID=170000 RepID=A0AAV0B1F4_PHAPC|nr:hypothetical protein PPACK8108_LOCUS11928 [Phakopsora pachyrhizi]